MPLDAAASLLPPWSEKILAECICRPALHMLDLLFNPRWEEAKTAAPPGSWRRWWHRWRLRRDFAAL